MRLHSLRLREFRGIEALDIDLAADHGGITLITGDTGSGKSTVLEGIVWALYGGGGGAVRRSEESLRRLTAAPDVATSAELGFSAASGEYVVRRELGGSTGRGAEPAAAAASEVPADGGVSEVATNPAPPDVHAELRRADGELLAAGDDDVTDSVAALLAAARERFLHACVTGRRELQQLAQLRPVDRLRTLARLLGRSVSRRLAMDPTLLEAVQALQQELAEADERIHALRSAPELLVQYTAELEQLRPQVAEAEALADRLQDEWSQKRQDVDTRLIAAARRAEELQQQIARLAAAGERGACPTCGRPLGGHAEALLAKLDDEYYVLTQDSKWLAQRQAQLARRPPELLDAESRSSRLRAAVDDRTARAARCEQAMQELWTVAGERKRAAARLASLQAGPPPAADSPRPIDADALAAVAALASGYLARITAGRYDAVRLLADGRVHGAAGDLIAPVVSGGEEDAIALAIRLAVMRIVAAGEGDLDILIVDEPFGSIDAAHELRVVALLREFAAQGLQVLLATRRQGLDTPADAVIRLGASR